MIWRLCHIRCSVLKAKDMRTIRYAQNNVKTEIFNAEYGRATIFDKDIWILLFQN